jgi:hypothetical protein
MVTNDAVVRIEMRNDHLIDMERSRLRLDHLSRFALRITLGQKSGQSFSTPLENKTMTYPAS